MSQQNDTGYIAMHWKEWSNIIRFCIRQACFLLVSTFLLFHPHQEALASEAKINGVWVGVIPCSPGKTIKKRWPAFETDGVKAWLTGYGTTGERYESELKNGKAKFKGIHQGVYQGEKFVKHIRVTAKILKNGDVKISGRRGADVCKGILKKNQLIAVNEFNIRYNPKQTTDCEAAPGSKPFQATGESLMTSMDLLTELRDVTLISRNEAGVHIMYIGKNQTSGSFETLGFLVDGSTIQVGSDRLRTLNWSVGTVRFPDNLYCRKWKQWANSTNEICWQIHKNRANQLYFVCPHTLAYERGAHEVAPGNAFNARLIGEADCETLPSGRKDLNSSCFVEFDNAAIEH